MAAVQRIKQGVRALAAFTQPVERELAADYLNDAQLALFDRMKRSEQLHSLNVLRSLQVQPEGEPSDSLAVAALLHDVGKIRGPLAIWQKSLAVLVRAFAPGVFTAWSQGDGSRSWEMACVVAEQHPAWSAELVAETGADETTLWLIRHHAESPANWRDHPDMALLERLRRADDEN